MKYGLKEKTIEQIQAVFFKYPNVEKAVLYGSRAKGNYKNGSDIDLTLHGKDLTLKIQHKIANELDDLLLPYKIDLSIFDQITNPEFIDHIQRVGIVFYERAIVNSQLSIDNGDVMRKGGKLEGWKVEKLGDLVDFMNGLWTGKKPPFINVGVIRNTNFTKNGELDDSDIVYLDVEKSQFAKRKLEYGDIVLEKSGGGPKQPVGRVVIFDKPQGEFSFSNFTSVVRIKNKSQLDFRYLHKYLFHSYLSGTTEKMQSHSTGIRNLKFDEYKQILVPIPPLPEQQRIVSVLDEAFASIAQAKSNAERNLVNAQELFESVLQSSFENAGEDWEEKKLEDFFSIKHGFAFKGEFFTDKGKYVLLTPGNFYEEGGYRDRGEKQKYYVGDFPKDYLLKKGDILVAMTEQAAGLLGSPIIIPESNIFLHNQRLGLIIYKEENKIDTKFLFHLFNTKRMRSLIHQSASGVKVRHTSPSKILEISAFIPPLAEQRAIVGRLEALSAETGRLEEIYESKVESLEELKRSVLGKAFAGEL